MEISSSSSSSHPPSSAVLRKLHRNQLSSSNLLSSSAGQEHGNLRGSVGQQQQSSKEKEWHPSRGEYVWVADGAASYIKTLVFQVNNENVETEAGLRPLSEVFPINPEAQDGVADNTMMDYLHEPNLLHNLSVRYNRDEIYTYTAYILIAINPYKTLQIYDEELMKKYHKRGASLPPHVFAIAERAYRQMIHAGRYQSQSIVCSGDSGSGKTESAKYLLRYLTTIASGGKGEQSVLEKRILEANPIMEAFGNAKTLRNNNSSRFGKFVRVHFSKESRVKGAELTTYMSYVVGADITTYLLEKPRLTLQPQGERNFHVFYQILKGATQSERDLWLLDNLSAPDFHYTRQSKCHEVVDIDDKSDYEHVRNALTCAGVSHDNQLSLLGIVASLLHLGNVSFVHSRKQNTDASSITEKGEDSLKRFCKLIQCDPSVVEKALLSRTMTARGDVISIPLKKEDAEFARDTLAKYIYNGLFEYIVKSINEGMPLLQPSSSFIGILDISGFEHFENNGFEQFLINYCNEKIQQYFIQQIMQQEQIIYQQEGLRWRTITYTDNAKCLELIEMKNHGILALLQEQCKLPQGSDEKFTINLSRVMGTNEKYLPLNKVPRQANIPGLGIRKFLEKDAFIVRHFASDVCYQTNGWMSKNNDATHEDLTGILRSSSSPVLSMLYKSSESVGSDPNIIIAKGDMKNTRFATISNTFSSSLSTLIESLNRTQSHFIRCINPNIDRKPLHINRPSVMSQLKCSGMLEALRILQAGFPTRCLFVDLFDRYSKFCPPELTSLGPKLFCEALLVALDLQRGADFQMGLSRVFFRAGKAAMMDDVISGDEDIFQRVLHKIKNWLAPKRWKQSIFAVISLLRFGEHIQDVRKAVSLREEKIRREMEEKMRRDHELAEQLRIKMEEERKRKEEEERKRREEEEKRRKEKEERKRKKEAEINRLKEEAEKKKDLQSQLSSEREMWRKSEVEMQSEISSLEQTVEKQNEERRSLEMELASVSSREKCLSEYKIVSDEEIAKLRKRIQDLETELHSVKGQLSRSVDQLAKAKEEFRLTLIEREEEELEQMERKDEEMAELRERSERKILELEKEKTALLDEMKRQSEKEVQRILEEKQKEVEALKNAADKQISHFSNLHENTLKDIERMREESSRELEFLQAEMQRKIEETREKADEAVEMSEKERERIRLESEERMRQLEQAKANLLEQTKQDLESRINKLINEGVESEKKLRELEEKRVKDLQVAEEKRVKERQEVETSKKEELDKTKKEAEEKILQKEYEVVETKDIINEIALQSARLIKMGYLWLLTEKSFGKKWKKYFFRLDGHVLLWYKKRESTEPMGIFLLENATCEDVFHEREFDGCEFEMRNPKSSAGPLFLRVDYKKDRSKWIETIRLVIERIPTLTTIDMDNVTVDALRSGLIPVAAPTPRNVGKN